MKLPAVMPAETATALAEARLRDAWIGRETLGLAVSPARLDLEVGDVLALEALPGSWRIEAIEDGEGRRLTCRAFGLQGEAGAAPDRGAPVPPPVGDFGPPLLRLLDLPVPQARAAPLLHAALWAQPFARRYALFSSAGGDGFRLRADMVAPSVTGTLLAPLEAGPEGRLDRGRALHLRLREGALSSASTGALLAGANVLAVACRNGEWELIQFASASLQGDGSWTLTGLLRAQGGTDPAMRAGASAGADVVLVDEALVPVPLEPQEAGLSLTWSAGPAVDSVGSEAHVTLAHRHADLGRRPLSPVHLRAAALADGTVRFGWIRRSRLDADDFEAAETPLGESAERYRVELAAPGGPVRRRVDVGEPAFLWTAADRDADALGAQVELRVAQIASSGLPGAWRARVFTV